MAGKIDNSNKWQRIEYYQKRYPELTHEEHEKLLKDKQKECLGKHPDSSGVNNPAHRTNTSAQQRRERSPMCLEFYIRKYPNNTLKENMKLHDEHIEKRRHIHDGKQLWSHTSINYYLEKGYSEEESQKLLDEALSRQFSRKRCIELHGEEEGIKIFLDRQQKWIKSINNTRKNRKSSAKYMTSMMEEDFVNILRDHIDKECFCMDTQFTLRDEELKRVYSYDFCTHNKIIEINGEYWHADPRKFKKDFYFKRRNLYAVDIWERDARKTKIAIDAGYEVLSIWETDIRKNKQHEIEKCLEFLLKE